MHRSTYLDYVGVKTFDEQGEVIGEKRFLGLFTSSGLHRVGDADPGAAATRSTRSSSAPASPPTPTRARTSLEVLETYPRDELFQADQDELHDNATAVLHLQERRKTRLFLRKRRVRPLHVRASSTSRATATTPRSGCAWSRSCGRRSRAPASTTRRASRSRRSRGCTSSCGSPRASASPRSTRPCSSSSWSTPPARGTRTSARRRASSTGEEAAAPAHRLYGKAFPEAYKEDFTPRVGVADIRHMEVARHRATSTGLNMYQEPGAPSRRAPVQALPPRPAVADPGAADVHAPRRRGRRRAALRDLARRRRHRPHLRLRPARAQREGLDRRRPRPHARAVPGRRGGGVERPRRVRRLQRARARRRADLAPGRHPARGREVPAADRIDLQPGLRRDRARRRTSRSQDAGEPVRGALRPQPVCRCGR